MAGKGTGKEGAGLIAASDALRRLRDGNRRFVTNRPIATSLADQKRRAAAVERQEPFAVVLGCSDSRVPAELIFDQGVGDLFVIRVAGNVVERSQAGSIEFAAGNLGTKLVVVLGHTRCGAVAATLDDIRGRPTIPSGNLRSIVDRVRPSVQELLSTRGDENPEGLLQDAVRANVRASVRELTAGSELLSRMIRKGELLVVGAEYSLETGVVTFLEDLPAISPPGRGRE